MVRVNQLTLAFEPGLAQRHRSLSDCLSTCVYRVGLTRAAGMMDVSPSALSENLSGSRGRDVSLAELERFIAATGDLAPIYYLLDRFCRDPRAQQLEAMTRLAELAQQLPALMAAAGLQPSAKGKR